MRVLCSPYLFRLHLYPFDTFVEIALLSAIGNIVDN